VQLVRVVELDVDDDDRHHGDAAQRLNRQQHMRPPGGFFALAGSITLSCRRLVNGAAERVNAWSGGELGPESREDRRRRRG